MNSRPGADVLDLGFGTGMLTARLYAAGHPVAGVDFSQNMLDAARTKMPCAELYLYDFTRGLPPALEGRTFDFIISTYAFHHVPDAGKPTFLLELSRRLSPGGECLIGDVAFETQAELDACHAAAGTAWDCGEDYAVAQLLAGALPSLRHFLRAAFPLRGGACHRAARLSAACLTQKTAKHRMSFIANR